jgi:hypothetical protein
MIAIETPQVNHAYTPQPIRNIRDFSRNPTVIAGQPANNQTETLHLILKATPSLQRHISRFLQTKLDEISQLQPNWDGYNAIPPNPIVIKESKAFLEGLPISVLQFLSIEEITPTPYGTIVMDFYNRGNKLSLEFGKTQIGFYSDFLNGENVESDGVKFDTTKLPNELEHAIKLFLQA